LSNIKKTDKKTVRGQVRTVEGKKPGPQAKKAAHDQA